MSSERSSTFRKIGRIKCLRLSQFPALMLKVRPLAVENAEDVIPRLREEILRTADSRYNHRLHALLLMARGKSAPEVASLLGEAPRTVEYWVRRFQREGLGGLVECERSGRPPRLTVEQLAEVALALRGQRWDGQTLKTFLEQRYSVTLSLRQVQNIHRRLAAAFEHQPPASLRKAPANGPPGRPAKTTGWAA